MSLVRVFYTANIYTIFVIGLLNCAFLLWLIAKHTPSVMLPYKKIILQACIIDFAMLFTQTLIQPIVFIDGNGVPTSVLVSPLVNWCPVPWNILIYNTWAFVNSINSKQYALLFFYRWLIVTRSYTLPFAVYMMLLIIPSFVHTLIQVVIGNDFQRSAIELNITDSIRNDLELRTSTHPIRSPCSTASNNLQTIQSWLSPLPFFAAIVFAVKTSLFVRRNLNGPNLKRDRELNSQLNKVMVLQAVVTFLFSYLPYLMLAGILKFWELHPSISDLIWVMNLSFLIGFWLPVVNAFVTIFSVKPYRNFVMWVCSTHFLPFQSSVQFAPSQGPVFVVS